MPLDDSESLKKVFNFIYFSMIIFIWCLFAFVAGQDYVSEVIYPDDLIPVEDREGKLDFQTKLNFLTFKF